MRGAEAEEAKEAEKAKAADAKEAAAEEPAAEVEEAGGSAEAEAEAGAPAEAEAEAAEAEVEEAEQGGPKQAAHVLGPLHHGALRYLVITPSYLAITPAAPQCAQPRWARCHARPVTWLSPLPGALNRGKYDAIYRLTPSFVDELRVFYGFGPSFPTEQLVTRSITGKALYLLAAPVLRLLAADSACKLKLVTTGAKVLERLDSFRGGGTSFKLAQVGSISSRPQPYL